MCCNPFSFFRGLRYFGVNPRFLACRSFLWRRSSAKYFPSKSPCPVATIFWSETPLAPARRSLLRLRVATEFSPSKSLCPVALVFPCFLSAFRRACIKRKRRGNPRLFNIPQSFVKPYFRKAAFRRGYGSAGA